MILTRRQRGGLPIAPQEIADEVEQYARESGRHCSLHFVPTVMTEGRGGKNVLRAMWLARFTLHPDDKRMVLYREGQVAEPPTDDVWFMEPNPDAGKLIPGTDGIREQDYRGLDIMQMGAAGVRAFLERGNLNSGRGQYQSLEDQLRQVREANAAAKAKNRADAQQASRDRTSERRRWWLGIPLVQAGMDLIQGRGRPRHDDLAAAPISKEKAS